MNVTYSGCVSLALGIQLAKRMLRIILSSVACSGLQYSSTIFGGGGDFLNLKCVFWLSLQRLSEIFFFRRILRLDIIHVHRFSCFLARF